MAKESRISKIKTDDPSVPKLFHTVLETKLIELQAKAFRLVCGRDNIGRELDQTLQQINQCQEEIHKETRDVNDAPNE